MRIKLTSVSIDDYDKALKFYTDVMGFLKKRDIPLGEGARWITVVLTGGSRWHKSCSSNRTAEYPAMKALKESLVRMECRSRRLKCRDIQAEYERMKNLGVEFTMEPTNMGDDDRGSTKDTCGNLIQIYQIMA